MLLSFTGVAGKSQLGAGRTLKDRAKLNIVGEVTVFRNEVSEAEHGGRRRFHEIEFASTGDGIRGIARVGGAA